MCVVCMHVCVCTFIHYYYCVFITIILTKKSKSYIAIISLFHDSGRYHQTPFSTHDAK